MKLLDVFQKRHAKKNTPDLRSGDVVRVHEQIKEGKKERIQIYEGIVISIKGGKNLNATFTVRKISLGIGVEKTYPLHSPKIIKVETIRRIRSKKSKLYYLRDLTQKQIQKRSELSKYVAWEDNKAKEEVEALKTKKEDEAKKKEAEKKAEQKEIDEKFAQNRGEEIKEPKDTKEKNKKDSDDSKESKGSSNDKKDEKPGK